MNFIVNETKKINPICRTKQHAHFLFGYKIGIKTYTQKKEQERIQEK